jgi:PAS domain S-box-containing protein
MKPTNVRIALANTDHSVRAGLFEAACEHAFESVLITTGNEGEGGYPIVYVNQAFTAMTGYEADEVIGKSPGILQGPKTDSAVIERLASDLSAGRTFHGQAVNYRKDGSEFMLEWKVTPFADAQGEITHLISVQREVG